MPSSKDIIQKDEGLALVTSKFLVALELRHASLRLEVKDGQLVAMELTEKISVKQQN
jgi:hypothetical protein